MVFATTEIFCAPWSFYKGEMHVFVNNMAQTSLKFPELLGKISSKSFYIQ